MRIVVDDEHATQLARLRHRLRRQQLEQGVDALGEHGRRVGDQFCRLEAQAFVRACFEQRGIAGDDRTAVRQIVPQSSARCSSRWVKALPACAPRTRLRRAGSRRASRMPVTEGSSRLPPDAERVRDLRIVAPAATSLIASRSRGLRAARVASRRGCR